MQLLLPGLPFCHVLLTCDTFFTFLISPPTACCLNGWKCPCHSEVFYCNQLGVRNCMPIKTAGVGSRYQPSFLSAGPAFSARVGTEEELGDISEVNMLLNHSHLSMNYLRLQFPNAGLGAKALSQCRGVSQKAKLTPFKGLPFL